MASSPASSTAVIVAGSALLAAAGLGYLAASTGSSNASSWPLTPSPDSNADDEEITAAEVCEIYARLLAALQATRDDLVRQIAPYYHQRHAAAAVPAREWKAALATELETALRQHQAELLQEYDIDRDCWEDAVRDFLEHSDGNERVRQIVTKFQLFWRNCADELFPMNDDAS